MYKETLLKEHDKFKRNVITFSILEGVCLVLLIFFTLIFSFSFAGYLFFYLENGLDMVISNDYFAVIFLLVFVFIVPIAIASDIFVPFIIINAVKLGNRNKALKRINEKN